MKRPLLTPRSLMLFTAAVHLAAAVYFSAVTPLGDTPDEYAHYEYIEYLLKHRAFPALEPDFYETAVHEAHQPPAYYITGALLTAWVPDRPPLHLQNNSFFKWDTPIPAYLPLPEHAFPWRGPVLQWHLLRFLSIAFGLLSLIFVYLSAREFFGRDAAWAHAGCVAFVGLNPQVIFIQTAVSNDCLTILAGAALTYAAIRLARRAEPASFGIAALAISFAALAKVNAVLLLPMLVPVGIFALLRLRSMKQRSAAVALVVVVPLVSAGWWYLRSIAIYGDLSGINMMRRTFEYREPLTAHEWFTQLPEAFWWTFVTAWGGFGWERILIPSPIAAAVLMFCLIALAGVVMQLIEHRWSKPARDAAARILAVGFLLGLTALTVGFLMYHRLLGSSSAWSGRRFFPALAIFAIGWVCGWRVWNTSVDRRLALGTFWGGLMLVLYSIFWIVRPLYAPPATKGDDFQPAKEISARFGETLELIGYDWPNESAPVLYWRLAGEPEDHFHAMLDLKDGATTATTLISPLEPRRPISSWPRGRIIEEPFAGIDGTIGRAILRVEKGFYTRSEVFPVDRVTSRTLGAIILVRDEAP